MSYLEVDTKKEAYKLVHVQQNYYLYYIRNMVKKIVMIYI